MSPKIFDPEVITVEEDSNVCNTKLAVIAEILVKPVKVAVVAPKFTSVVPIVTPSLANLTLVILPSRTALVKRAYEAVANGERVFAITATEDVCANIAVEADVAVTVDAKLFAITATEDVCAFIAVEAEVAVTVGAKEFARKATEEVCDNIAVEDESEELAMFENDENDAEIAPATPEKEPLKCPLAVVTNRVLPVILTLVPEFGIIVPTFNVLMSINMF